MMLSGLQIFATAALLITGVVEIKAADATAPIDYTQRNAPFAPAATVGPDKKTPETNAAVQEKRVDKTIVEKKPAAVGDRRSPIEVKETREKNVREKDSHRPESLDRKVSPLNGREAPMSTASDQVKPELVGKYQDGLTSASATNMARYPALGRATGAKINRFVFRKNASNPAAALDGAPVIPAAGGAVVKKP